MSLERMFEDLEGRLAHLEAQQVRATAEDLARGERAQIPLADRLRGAIGARLVVHGDPGIVAEGRLTEVGEGWFGLLGLATATRLVVPLGAVTVIEGLESRVRPEGPGRVPSQSLRQVLRSISRDRALVRISTRGGVHTGRIAAVGEDALDLTRSPTGERSAGVGAVTSTGITVPLAAVQLLAVSP